MYKKSLVFLILNSRLDGTQTVAKQKNKKKKKMQNFQALRTFKQTNCLYDLDVYFTARNRFKAITRNSKTEYHKHNRQQLVEARNNPKSRP